MFHPEKELYRIILDSLGKEGKSISSLSKDLERKGHKFHRLILTGYLRALTDMRVLREREVPPAKIYSLSGKARPDIYGTIAEKAKNMVSGQEADDLSLFAATNLLKRPLFEDEMEHMGIDPASAGRASNEEAEDARRALNRRGFRIPKGAYAYVPSGEVDKNDYLRMLEELIVEELDLTHLVVGTRQTRLF